MHQIRFSWIDKGIRQDGGYRGAVHGQPQRRNLAAGAFELPLDRHGLIIVAGMN